MAIAFVNAVTVSASASATTIAATAQSHTTGNTVVVFTSNYTATVRAVSSIADTAGNTYTKAGGDYGGDASHRMEAWVATNITGHATNVVTVTFSAAAANRVIGVIQYSGLHATSPYDASATGSIQVGTNILTSNAVTTTSNDQIVLGWWISWANPKAFNSSSGSSTTRAESGALDNSLITDVVAATTGAYTTAIDQVTSETAEYAVIVRSFKAAGAAAASLINRNVARMAAMIVH